MRRPPIGGATKQAPTRDFGVLKVRKMKVKQTEAVIYDKKSQDFSRMSNDRLIKICYSKDMEQKRALSRWFFEQNGMYNRAVRYLSDISKFDFMLYPNLDLDKEIHCLLYTSPSPRDKRQSRMPSSA